LEAGVDIVYLNSFGTPVGRIFSSSPKGMAELRKAQVVLSSSSKALELSRRLVAAKGTNQVARDRWKRPKILSPFSREFIGYRAGVLGRQKAGGESGHPPSDAVPGPVFSGQTQRLRAVSI